MEIYVHIPFCARKCAYCDFTSFVCSEAVQRKYFDALKKQIELKAETAGGEPVVSCFFGGGTPSLPEAELTADILGKLKECFSFESNAEITIEANPNSATAEKLDILREAGFNRLSIGLQSALDTELESLTRLHTYGEFLKTYEAARRAGFQNINIDLMSAIPGQTLKSYEKTLERVTELKPQHISAYSLILEEGTPFYERYAGGKGLPDEDTEREMYYLTKAFLKEKGYSRYEISNYSLPGRECRHNYGYWKRTPYLGFGLAAASLYEETRYQMHTDLERYLEGDFSEEREVLSRADIISEYMFLGLRLTEGVSRAEFKSLFGTEMEDLYGEALEKLSVEGLLVNSERVYLTDRGMDVANYCMSEFILED